IIAVEMMAVKMEQGLDRLRAAAFAWTSTAFPMLTGTLVTAAGFLPIATAASSTGEYTRSLFQVVVIALLLSWIAAVVFIPYLGDKLLPDPRPHDDGGVAHDPYDTRFYRRFRGWLELCLRWRRTVIVVTALAFVASLDRKSTRLNSSHVKISYAVFCLKKKKILRNQLPYETNQ